VQFYAHHLETMNARVDQFRRLLEDDWRRAWQAREGGFQGFTNDVQIAWTAIRCALLSTECNVLRREQLLGAAIRCALCMSSVCSLGANIPASLLGACLQRGILKASQALHLAGLQDGPRGRAEAFTAILPYLGESERTRGLTEALDAIGDMSDPALTVTLLAELASQIGPAFWNRAVDIANRISNQENRAQALAILMLHSNSQEEKSTLFEHALALTKSLSRPSIVKTLLLAGLAFRRSDVDGDFPNASELFSEAFAVASSIKDDFFKID
jgi:hypothetical protein